MVPWGTPFVLVGSDKEVAEAAFRLHRIGYDHPAGYLAGGVEAWAKADLPTRNLKLVEPAELKEQMGAATAPLIVDVRLPKEWMGLRISETILNMPINELAQHSSQLDPDMPVMTVCNSAYRSSMGASVLLKQGFKNVLNLKGGGKAWIKAGFPTFSAKPGKHTAAPHVFLDLPERMNPLDLAQRLTDLPGSVEVVDIRPGWQYNEFHIPGSILSSPADVLSNPAYLVGKVPLVIVCRDGSISAAVGGTITPKTERSIRYVSGGVTAYWAEVMKPAGVITEKMVKPPPSPAVPAPKATPAPSKPKRKRPSAGC
jgi:rhodanese-related sulfurtransferase